MTPERMSPLRLRQDRIARARRRIGRDGRPLAPIAARRSLLAVAIAAALLSGCERPLGGGARQPALPTPTAQPAVKLPAPWPPPADDRTAPFVPRGPQHLATIELRLNGRWLTTEVARTEPERQTGLMFRRDLPDDAGMLFVFPFDDFRAFWMHETPLPLSIAYVARDGTITQIADMQSFDEGLTPSREQVPFALEVHQGWFRAAGVREGDRVEGLERAGGGT